MSHEQLPPDVIELLDRLADRAISDTYPPTGSFNTDQFHDAMKKKVPGITKEQAKKKLAHLISVGEIKKTSRRFMVNGSRNWYFYPAKVGDV